MYIKINKKYNTRSGKRWESKVQNGVFTRRNSIEVVALAEKQEKPIRQIAKYPGSTRTYCAAGCRLL